MARQQLKVVSGQDHMEDTSYALLNISESEDVSVAAGALPTDNGEEEEGAGQWTRRGGGTQRVAKVIAMTVVLLGGALGISCVVSGKRSAVALLMPRLSAGAGAAKAGDTDMKVFEVTDDFSVDTTAPPVDMCSSFSACGDGFEVKPNADSIPCNPAGCDISTCCQEVTTTTTQVTGIGGTVLGEMLISVWRGSESPCAPELTNSTDGQQVSDCGRFVADPKAPDDIAEAIAAAAGGSVEPSMVKVKTPLTCSPQSSAFGLAAPYELVVEKGCETVAMNLARNSSSAEATKVLQEAAGPAFKMQVEDITSHAVCGGVQTTVNPCGTTPSPATTVSATPLTGRRLRAGPGAGQ